MNRNGLVPIVTMITPWQVWLHVRKYVFWLILLIFLIIGVILLDIIGGKFLVGLKTKPVERAAALLFSDNHFNELPDKVELKIDGISAVFRRGSKPFDELVVLLHNGRSSKLLESTGRPIGFPDLGTAYGELVIQSYGMTSRFKIFRGKDNKNIYWIALPKLTASGTGFPIFTADPRVVDLVKANSVNGNQ